MFNMVHYCSKQPDGTIHIQNAVMGYPGPAPRPHGRGA